MLLVTSKFSKLFAPKNPFSFNNFLPITASTSVNEYISPFVLSTSSDFIVNFSSDKIKPDIFFIFKTAFINKVFIALIIPFSLFILFFDSIFAVPFERIVPELLFISSSEDIVISLSPIIKPCSFVRPLLIIFTPASALEI